LRKKRIAVLLYPGREKFAPGIAMNLAATLIALKARHCARPFLKAVGDPASAQKRLLETILQRNRDTEYGRRYRFSSIRDLEDYQREVPIIDYEGIRTEIDRMTRGEPNVLTAEAPVMFAQTSGTTGAPKFIPVTPTCQKQGGTAIWLYFARRDHPSMLAGKVITIVSPAVEGHTPGGIPYGSTSGMVVRELPRIVQKTYAVPYDAFEISDYDAEYYTLLRFGLPENITLLASANPSSVLMLAEMADRLADPLIRDIRDGKLGAEFEIEGPLRKSLAPRLRADPARARELERMRKARDGRLSPADYWPRLALIGCWKGGTVGSYLDRFPEWFDPDGRGMPPVRDMGYLASEARMSVPVSDHDAGGVLTVNLNVFELVPVEEVEAHPDDPEAWSPLGVHEVEVGKEYHVLITTTGGTLSLRHQRHPRGGRPLARDAGRRLSSQGTRNDESDGRKGFRESLDRSDRQGGGNDGPGRIAFQGRDRRRGVAVHFQDRVRTTALGGGRPQVSRRHGPRLGRMQPRVEIEARQQTTARAGASGDEAGLVRTRQTTARRRWQALVPVEDDPARRQSGVSTRARRDRIRDKWELVKTV
jgi:hypothetical protein